MCQINFSDFEYAGQHKQTRLEQCLVEEGQVVLWSNLLQLIKPYVSKGGDDRNHHALEPRAWQLTTRLSTDSQPNWHSLIVKPKPEIKYAQPQMKDKIKYPFQVLTHPFGYVNLRFRTRMKKHHSLSTRCLSDPVYRSKIANEYVRVTGVTKRIEPKVQHFCARRSAV